MDPYPVITGPFMYGGFFASLCSGIYLAVCEARWRAERK